MSGRGEHVPLADTDDYIGEPKRTICTRKRVFLGVAVLAVVLFIVLIVALVNESSSSSSSSSNYVSQETKDGAARIIQLALAPNNSGMVWNRLAKITDDYGPRFSGSQALEDAMTDIVNTIRTEDNLTVEEEGPVPVPHWVRGTEYARMISPRNKTLHMIGLGGVNGTKGADGQFAPIQAEVLVVKNFSMLDTYGARGMVNGRIVLYNVDWVNYGTNVQYRSQGGVRAAAYGAVGVLIRSVAPYGIQTPHTGGSDASSPIASAAISIEDSLQIQRLTDRGKTVIVEMYMEGQTLPEFDSRNLVITITGSTKPNEFVVIGGHIDSWDNAEGAMDDGGGAFIAWEAVRLIHVLGLKPKRTIRAVFWTNEENGARGGQDFASRHMAELNGTSIAIESDTGPFAPYGLGYTGSKALPILQEIGQLLEPINAGRIVSGGGGVDITPMCNQGVPCGSIETLDPRATFDGVNNPCQFTQESLAPIPTSGAIAEGYFWYHHSAGDTVDKLDPVQLQKGAAAFGVWAYAIANLDELLPRG